MSYYVVAINRLGAQFANLEIRARMLENMKGIMWVLDTPVSPAQVRRQGA